MKHVNLGSSVPYEPMSSISTDKLISFAATSLFHKETGIKSRPIVLRLCTFKSAIYDADLVDGIMERSSFKSKEIVKSIAQHLLDVGLVYKVASIKKVFQDNKNSVYQCHFQLHRDDEGH